MHTTCFPYEFPPASKWHVKVSEKRNKNTTKERLDEEGDKERIRGTIRQKRNSDVRDCYRKYIHMKSKVEVDEETRRNVNYERAFTDGRCPVPRNTETGIAEVNHSDTCCAISIQFKLCSP